MSRPPVSAEIVRLWVEAGYSRESLDWNTSILRFSLLVSEGKKRRAVPEAPSERARNAAAVAEAAARAGEPR